MSEGKHAVLSPSGAHRWMACPASVLMERGRPNTDSVHSKEGTAAHELASTVLENDTLLCGAFVGRIMENGVEVTEDMATETQKYVDYVRDVTEAIDGVLMVEQHLPLVDITGEEGAEGTSDAVIIGGCELTVVDLKFGRGNVVYAENNKQLLKYALAAHNHFGVVGGYSSARLVIHQPRLNHVDEWVIPLEQLLAFQEQVSQAVARVGVVLSRGTAEPEDFAPSEKACQWCKASGDCKAQDAKIAEDVGASFEDLTVQPSTAFTITELGVKMDAIDFIESWCKAVRAKGESALLSGQEVLGSAGPYKLVKGKKGNRKWTDEKEAETTLKGFRLTKDQMYDYTLISPTTADKLHKAKTLSKDRWATLATLIGQSEGGLHVAPATDKRPAVVPEDEANSFEDLTAPPLV